MLTTQCHLRIGFDEARTCNGGKFIDGQRVRWHGCLFDKVEQRIHFIHNRKTMAILNDILREKKAAYNLVPIVSRL
ncbi:MAG: hypothetical protein JWP57_941 [Spirosoma sp.]|nr:hypothetical protein [Spirosoma sp.]